MARRRPILGTPLLVTSTAMALSVGCGGAKDAPVGNLMPPPEPSSVEVCVDTVPADARVEVDGAVVEDRCATVTVGAGTVHIEATAPGYLSSAVDLPADQRVETRIELTPMPVGNPMPPPTEVPRSPIEPAPEPVEPPPPPEIDRPVGNLMPPPSTEKRSQ